MPDGGAHAHVGARDPVRDGVVHGLVRAHFAAFAEQAQEGGRALPRYVIEEFDAFLRCGVLACGFMRARCPGCGHDRLVAFSCKHRGVCSSAGSCAALIEGLASGAVTLPPNSAPDVLDQLRTALTNERTSAWGTSGPNHANGSKGLRDGLCRALTERLRAEGFPVRFVDLGAAGHDYVSGAGVTAGATRWRGSRGKAEPPLLGSVRACLKTTLPTCAAGPVPQGPRVAQCPPTHRSRHAPPAPSAGPSLQLSRVPRAPTWRDGQA
ncbi:MAG: transposase zinc-binding domain-containing protein, partial [Deltaproteobacteria bacterium]|nr:transposase zinc-binding domain-containing protein [Deltaproteobacteria bacterium]